MPAALLLSPLNRSGGRSFVRVLVRATGVRLCALVLAALGSAAETQVAAGAASSQSAQVSPAALARPGVPGPRLLLDNGARAVWSPSRRRAVIGYDSIVDENNRDMAVFVIDVDGGNRRCVTCATSVPKGFVGMMDWLPDGKHLLVTAENERSLHRRFNHPAFGIDNDLWLVSVDGKRAERIWRASAKGGAVLNARVNRAGTLLFFAERVPTDRPLPRALRRFGPWGEDQWAGWRLHVAEINVRRQGEAVLRNHRTLQPNGAGFYESSGFSPDGEFIYAFTREGQRYCDDVWSLGARALHPRNLTNSSATWEEHGQYSSDGAWFGYVSSLFNPTLRFPGADNAELVSELYLQRTGGPAARMTYFNNAADEQAVSGVPGTVASPLHAGHAKSVAGRVVSRLSFSPDSRRVLMQVAPSDRIAPPQLWLQDLPR